MAIAIILAAAVSLASTSDWESGRLVSSSNGWLSVTGHGGSLHARATREMFAVPKDGSPVVFEAETFQVREHEGRHSAEFWFQCYGANREELKPAYVCRTSDGRFPEEADGWRRLRLELKPIPGTAAVRVGCAVGASKYDHTRPHTLLRNLRLTGVGPLPDLPGRASAAVPADAFETCVSFAPGRREFRLHFGHGVPMTVSFEPIADGLRLEPFGIPYRIGAPSNVVFSVRSRGARAQFYVDGNYIGSRVVQGSLVCVSDLAPGAHVAQIPDTRDMGREGFELVRLAPFDLAKATKKSEGLISLRAMTNSCVRTVPAEQYVRAWVTCAADPDPKKDRAFTLRLSRYNDIKGAGHVGRGLSGMAQTLVELDAARKMQIGETKLGGRTVPLWRVEVPLGLGQIPDIVFTDQIGTFLRELVRNGFGRYLDLELLGRTYAFHQARFDQRQDPDPKFTSAITVFGVELERPGCEMDFFQTHPGNVFEEGETPETGVELRVKRPGDYRLDWRISDAEGCEVGRGSRTAREGGRFLVSLAQRNPGWYRLEFVLYDGVDRLMGHEASFALLGADTRKTERGEGPYIADAYLGAHYSCGDFDVIGELIRKIGARRCPCNVGHLPLGRREKWKISPADLTMIYRANRSDEARLKAAIRKSLEDDPHVRELMVFHESYPWAYCQAPEMTGQRPTDDLVWCKDKKEWQQHRFTNAMSEVRFFRENFPEVKICLGNSLACTALIGNMIRDGFPEAYADYMGLEVLNRCMLPEKLGEANIQCADYMYETARAFGYGKWKVNNMWESNYRTAAIIGQDRAAAWYARDFILSHLWRFPDINLGNIEEVGNDYANGFWGQAGHCTRNPYHYPKKSFVTTAVVTRLLDMVTDFRHIPTGDESVYAVEFARRDGKYVTAFWTSNGTAPLEVCARNGFTGEDAYGRAFEPKGVFGNIFRRVQRYRFTADDWVRYLVSDTPTVVSVSVVGRRDYSKSWTRPPAGGRTVVDPTDAPAVVLRKEKEPLLEKTTGVFLPYRTLGRYALREVTDEEEGRCWELELVEPNFTLPKAIAEYAVVEFENPVELTGDPGTIGMRVKGNSGFGLVHWVVEDANGIRRISCGNSHGVESDPYDSAGRTLLAFSGWNWVTIPLSDRSSIYEETIGAAEHQWQAGGIGKDGKFGFVGGPPKYPLKLVGFAFSAWNRPLFLEERRPFPQKVRFGRIAVFD